MTRHRTGHRPASERIADLFSAMAPRRRTLLGMIAVPQTTDALDAEVDRLQADKPPRSLANAAGALARVTADGEPPRGRSSEVDGVSTTRPEAPEAAWNTPPTSPSTAWTDLLSEDAKYATIYELRPYRPGERRLDADHQRGRGQRRAAELLSLYAPHFIDKLEKCDAVEWRDKSWPEVGRAGTPSWPTS